MTDYAGLWQATLEGIGKCLLIHLKRMAGHKHCDLILISSVIMSFGMLLVVSTSS